ncbi:hypothetical protein [Methylogaea oryzae]|uniref:hypothetical protein n=1 Tax=Methylogaea oryzae TaxID=1295382 RepID=UPI0012E17C6D|nr:hypothetical protein [Methylogaea oryzae]
MQNHRGGGFALVAEQGVAALGLSSCRNCLAALKKTKINKVGTVLASGVARLIGHPMDGRQTDKG